MAKKSKSRTHVFHAAFDDLCTFFGPWRDGGDQRIAKIVGRHIRTVRDWRTGAENCPRWAYELVRLTYAEQRANLEWMTGRYRTVRKLAQLGGTRELMSLGDTFGRMAANDGFQVVEISPDLVDTPSA